MRYCTEIDVRNAAGGAEALRQLSDWNQDQFPDTLTIGDHIDLVSRWFDTYAVRQYTVPLDETVYDLSSLSLLVAEEVVYRLKKHRRMLTNDDRDDHNDVLLWLDNLSRNRVQIPKLASPQAEGASTGTISSASGDYDVEDREGFW